MSSRSKLVKAAAITAFALATLCLLGILLGGPVVLLPYVLIWFLGGLAIWRRRVWGGYGLALFKISQLVITIVTWSRVDATHLYEFMLAGTVLLGLSILFFLAGRSLAISGGERGSRSPWIATSAMCTVPFLFLQPFVMPTGSMEDALVVGDRFLVQRLPKVSPQTGDIIVFVYPPDRRQTHVKRLMGTSGDRIRIANKKVYRNGVEMTEAYASHRTDYVDSYRDNFPSQPSMGLVAGGQEMLTNHVINGEVVVPPGKYFVLGDNRDYSLDSRYFGFVDAQDLIGRPVLIYDSRDQPSLGISEDESPSLFQTRWERLFKRPK